MMVIKELSSQVDLAAGESRHLMVVGLLDGGTFVVPIDSVTYGNLVSAFEQLHLDAQSEPHGTQRPYVEPEPTPTVEDVRRRVEGHLGHQLAPGPVPAEEAAATELLRQLEQDHTSGDPDATALLKSVGFFNGPAPQDGDLDVLAVSSDTDDDEPDPGEELFPDDEDDGVEAY